MPEQDYKSVFMSKTFIGAVVALLATMAPPIFTCLGVSNDAVGQATIVAHTLSIVGFVVAVHGRMVATQPVSFSGKPPIALPAAPVVVVAGGPSGPSA